MKLLFISLLTLGGLYSINGEHGDCDTFQWRCDNGQCIDSADRCDGITHCLDKSDETAVNCIANECPKFLFRCMYGACVRSTAECDGRNDCADDSDEMTERCPSIIHAAFSQGNCRQGEFKCESKECITEDLLCDGKTDCKDGSDERIEHCAAMPCPSWAFRCGYGACVSSHAKCNGQKDCADDSDENRLLCNYADHKPVVTTQKPYVPPSTGSCTLTELPLEGNVYYSSDNTTRLKLNEVVENLVSVTYKCRANHKVVGSSINICNNGQWSFQAPTCQAFCNPKEIDKLSFGASCSRRSGNHLVRVDCSSDLYPETVATIYCKTGYNSLSKIADVDSQPRCTEDGRWNPPPNPCNQVCGKKGGGGTAYIVGGLETNITEVPWHVGIYRKGKTGQYEQDCGGTIISAKTVISAMHCFWDPAEDRLRDLSKYIIVAGKFLRDYTAREELLTQQFFIDSIHKHEGYRDLSGNYAADIAVVVLSNYIEFKDHIAPICLPSNLKFDEKLVKADSKGLVAGWGLESTNGQPSKVLKIIELPVISREICEAKSTPEFRPYITSDKFCAGYLTGQSVCQGDSGGGLVFPEKVNGEDRYFLRGVVSTGANKANSCDNDKYTTFVNVAYFSDFIEQYDVRPS